MSEPKITGDKLWLDIGEVPRIINRSCYLITHPHDSAGEAIGQSRVAVTLYPVPEEERETSGTFENFFKVD